MQGKVHISELLALADSFVDHWDKKFQLAEIELVLLDLQGLNRLMYDETNRKPATKIKHNNMSQ